MRASVDREDDGERCSAGRAVTDADRTAVRVDDGLADGESDAGRAGAATGAERLEDAGAVRVRDTGSVVGDDEPHRVGEPARGDAHLRPRGAVAHRVLDQV